MPLNLKIDTISIPTIPDKIGKQTALKALEEQLLDYLKILRADWQEIVKQGLKTSSITNPQVSLFNPFQLLFDKIQQLPNCYTKKVLEQQLRIGLLIINNRIADLSELAKQAFVVMRDTITNAIGTVPTLNASVPLPDEEHLPKQYTKSKLIWVTKAYQDPSRNSANEPLDFFVRGDDLGQISSVRRHLLCLDINTKNDKEALSYEDADFYAIGDLQADHLQPSENIIERQQELVLAMNIDPLFAEEVLQHPESKNYFIKATLDGIEQYVGTRYFYMVYHNCIDNLWLISTAANTGQGKGNGDAIDWLKTHPRFSGAFFASMGGEASINRNTLLYTTAVGVILAQAARKWFLETYKEEIAAVGFVRTEISKPAKKQLTKIIEDNKEDNKKLKKEKVKYMVRLALSSIFMQKPESVPSSPSSQSSDDSFSAEINSTNISSVKKIVQNQLDVNNIINVARESYKKETKSMRNKR